MSLIRFNVRNGEDPTNRPDNVDFNWTVAFAVMSARTPTTVRKDTMAMDGLSGASRVRGKYYEGNIEIPHILDSQIGIVRDMLEAAVEGVNNPLFCDGTDNFGIVKTFNFFIPDLSVEPSYKSCGNWSLGFPYREIR